jgi:hypothetical protein
VKEEIDLRIAREANAAHGLPQDIARLVKVRREHDQGAGDHRGDGGERNGRNGDDLPQTQPRPRA